MHPTLCRNLRGMTLERVSLVFGFGLSIMGAMGAQFFLAPAAGRVQAAVRTLDDDWARLKIIRSANALLGLLQSVDGMVFLVPADFKGNPNGADAVAEITIRAIHARHDAVRNYFAQAASAGEIDYDDVSRRYDKLVAAETANWSLETYLATNELPTRISTKVAADRWKIEKSTIQEEQNFFRRLVEKQSRSWILVLLNVASSTVLFTLALAAAREDRPAPPGRQSGKMNRAIHLMNLALVEARRRVDEAKAGG